MNASIGRSSREDSKIITDLVFTYRASQRAIIAIYGNGLVITSQEYRCI